MQYLFFLSVTLLITFDNATIEKPYASIVSFANFNTFSLVFNATGNLNQIRIYKNSVPKNSKMPLYKREVLALLILSVNPYI